MFQQQNAHFVCKHNQVRGLLARERGWRRGPGAGVDTYGCSSNKTRISCVNTIKCVGCWPGSGDGDEGPVRGWILTHCVNTQWEDDYEIDQ